MSNFEELWANRTVHVQGSLWAQDVVRFRKATNSCNASSRDTVSSGWFSLNNFLVPLMFLHQ